MVERYRKWGGDPKGKNGRGTVFAEIIGCKFPRN